MATKLRIDNGATAGEFVVNGSDSNGIIKATVSVFLSREKGRETKVYVSSVLKRDVTRLARVVVAHAEEEDWAGAQGTISYELEKWARAHLDIG